MKILALVAAVMCVMLLSGCAAKATGGGGAYGTPAARGTKPLSQVSPCCHDLVLGNRTLAECMQNPPCVANDRQCCMNAF